MFDRCKTFVAFEMFNRDADTNAAAIGYLLHGMKDVCPLTAYIAQQYAGHHSEFPAVYTWVLLSQIVRSRDMMQSITQLAAAANITPAMLDSFALDIRGECNERGIGIETAPWSARCSVVSQ